MTEKNEIYHEKQSRSLCAMHALNNLFQKPKTFTKSQLDEICNRLAPEAFINPHRSMIGLGNYDVNVIMAAVQSRDMDTVWFDKRRDINQLNIEHIFGFILNIPSGFKLGLVHLPAKFGKHWIAVRKIGDNFYNLDSKLSHPEVIGDEEKLQKFLTEELRSKEKELLLVVSHDVAQSAVWMNDSASNGRCVSQNSAADHG